MILLLVSGATTTGILPWRESTRVCVVGWNAKLIFRPWYAWVWSHARFGYRYALIEWRWQMPWCHDAWSITITGEYCWVANILAQAHGRPDEQNVRIERAPVPSSWWYDIEAGSSCAVHKRLHTYQLRSKRREAPAPHLEFSSLSLHKYSLHVNKLCGVTLCSS